VRERDEEREGEKESVREREERENEGGREGNRMSSYRTVYCYYWSLLQKSPIKETIEQLRKNENKLVHGA